MKKIILILVALLMVSTPCYAYTKKAVICSDMKTAEKYLDESLALNNFDYIHKDSEKHIYSIGSAGLYSSIVNLARAKDTTEGQTTKRLDGHYSCYFKEIDKNHILVRCVDSASMSKALGAYTGLMFANVGYRSYFKHLKYNDVQVVSLRKYKKSKQTINNLL